MQGGSVIFKFELDAKADIGTEDPWYALTEGYLKPEDVLSDPSQISSLKKAIELVEDFINDCYAEGVIEES